NSGRKIIKVRCYSAANHQILKDGLIKEKVEFYTYSRKDEKLPKVVIKGLPNFVQSDLPEELESVGFAGAVISELRTLRSTESNHSPADKIGNSLQPTKHPLTKP
ncbi:unnamed protein product, partial [Leptidea sinapis]